MYVDYYNSNNYNISDNWGWYVDIETSLPTDNNYQQIKIDNTKLKKLSIHLNKLDKIVEEEHEYDYDVKNNKNDRNDKNDKNDYNSFVQKNLIIKVEKIEENIKKNNENITIFKVISTTLITLSLTYIIWFII
jgi:hypothetical protein